MRRGDFSVEVVAVRGDDVRELESGHVIARPGAVYALRLRNYGPLRAVSNIHIDGKPVTSGGLVLDPYSAVTLERPVDETETGRFTVIAEGDERVFGPDGGRDNPDLGSIDASFRRELPRETRDRDPIRPLRDVPTLPFPTSSPPTWPAPGRLMAPPEWVPLNSAAQASEPPDIMASMSRSYAPEREQPADFIERAAGTGLTGHSGQRFMPIALGPLERDATVIRLRLAIGTEEALAAPRPLPVAEDDHVPARPAARP
jgi:hypothetical protein